MSVKGKKWKRGRGKLGVMEPLIGRWVAVADSPQGKVRCVRSFTKVLSGKYLQLEADWRFGKSHYQEIALFGVRANGKVGFWSFTSDGKHSEGEWVDVRRAHPEAFGFQARMPAGLGRMIFFPADGPGFHWVVEAKTKKGWTRIVEHHYRPA